MTQNYYQYLQWLQSCIQRQDQQIKQLEATVLKMKEEFNQLKEKPTIHVDTIEYKFDQLKVETVEGTLSIGLSPTDFQGIEDFAVNNGTLNTPSDPKHVMTRSMEIEDAIIQYLETSLPEIIQKTGNRLNIQANEEYLNFIKEDIKKQLPTRIDFHLKAMRQSEKSAEEMAVNNQRIIELLKKEIHNGVSIFLNHFQEK